MGLRGFAFHPDFATAGKPGHRKLYTVSTETAGSRPSSVKLFKDNYPVDHHDVVAEWSVDDATNPTRVLPSTRRELLRIAMYKTEHNTDTLMFDPNAAPGSLGYGMMFMTVGDGGNVPQHIDPHNQAQNPGRALGKILRINPLQQGTAAYGIPQDNPFVGRAGHLPEVWALGLRHPQNLSFDIGGTGAMVISDVGQRTVEEVNLGVKGGNYGWPLREGTFVTDRFDSTSLYQLAPNDARHNLIYPVAQYDHDEGDVRATKSAIVGGYVYRGTAAPDLVGQYLCGDIVNGRVFHVAVSALQVGQQAVLRELSFIHDGAAVTLANLVGGVNRRVDLRFGQDESGEVYIVTKQDGKIRKMRTPAATVV